MELLILAAIWAVVLVPPWIAGRSRASAKTRHGLQAYSDDMYLDTSFVDEEFVDKALDEGVSDDGGEDEREPHLIESVPLRRPAVVSAPQRSGVRLGPPAPQPLQAGSRRALHRRRRVFFGLVALTFATLITAVVLANPIGWVIHAAVVALFLTYVMLLVLHHQRALEHGTKVHFLGPVDDTPIRRPRPAVVVLRSGTAR